MRTLLFLCFVAICGCVSQDPRVPQLQYEVRALKEDVTEMSKRLDKTTITATSAKATASKNTQKVDDVKRIADKAADTALNAVLDAKDNDMKSPMPPSNKEPAILKPREINHETTLFQK